jgi:hypothetical protein
LISLKKLFKKQHYLINLKIKQGLIIIIYITYI